MIEDFYEKGMTFAELSRKYGRSETRCRQIIRKYAIDYRAQNGSARQVKKPSPEERAHSRGKPLSTQHMLLGIRIQRYLDYNVMSASAFGMMLSPMKSGNLINRAVAGTYDWTLVELQNLAQFFNCEIDDLWKQEDIHRAFA